MQRAGHTGLVATSDTMLVPPDCQWAWMAHVPHFIFTSTSSISTLPEQEFQVCLGRREMQCHHPTGWILAMLAAAAAPGVSLLIALSSFGLESQQCCAAVVQPRVPALLETLYGDSAAAGRGVTPHPTLALCLPDKEKGRGQPLLSAKLPVCSKARETVTRGNPS